MHPVTLRNNDKTRIASFLKNHFGHLENVNWEEVSLASLPFLLKSSSFHITYNSSTVVEAAWLGIPSAVFCHLLGNSEIWSDAFAKEKSMGLVTILSDDEVRIQEWLFKSKSSKKNRTLDILYGQNQELMRFLKHVCKTCMR
jgi:hypothetical protein